MRYGFTIGSAFAERGDFRAGSIEASMTKHSSRYQTSKIAEAEHAMAPACMDIYSVATLSHLLQQPHLREGARQQHPKSHRHQVLCADDAEVRGLRTLCYLLSLPGTGCPGHRVLFRVCGHIVIYID